MGWGSWQKTVVRDKAQGSGLRSWALWDGGSPLDGNMKELVTPLPQTHTQRLRGVLSAGHS